MIQVVWDLRVAQNFDKLSKSCCGQPMAIERIGVHHPSVRLEARCSRCASISRAEFDLRRIASWLTDHPTLPVRFPGPVGSAFANVLSAPAPFSFSLQPALCARMVSCSAELDCIEPSFLASSLFLDIVRQNRFSQYRGPRIIPPVRKSMRSTDSTTRSTGWAAACCRLKTSSPHRHQDCSPSRPGRLPGIPEMSLRDQKAMWGASARAFVTTASIQTGENRNGS